MGMLNQELTKFFQEYAKSSVMCTNLLFKVMCMGLTYLSQCKDDGIIHGQLQDGVNLTKDILKVLKSCQDKEGSKSYAFLEPLLSYEQALLEYIAILLIDFSRTTPSIFNSIPEILEIITFSELGQLTSDQKFTVKERYHSL